MPDPNPAPRIGRWTRIGLIILAISMGFWASLLVVPILPLSTGKKAILGGIVFVLAEVTFWGGAILAGKETVQKYQDRLNPFKRRRKDSGIDV
jgi:hypothetical protein